MRYRLLVGVLAVCFAATAQTLSVPQLVSFIQSSEQLIKEGKQTDAELAKYLAKVKLTERLDDRVIEELRKRGYEVFLDLKLHDIPNTVAGAVRSVADVGASLLTVHAGGGEQMMHAAVQAARAPGAPKLLAVTVLTSMDAAELRKVGVGGAHGSAANALHSQVLRLARLARSAGIDGLVCSAEEVEAVRTAMGPEMLLVVPGIRPTGSAGQRDDQRRVASATEAIARGASMLVVGRPITESANPARVAAGILAEIAGAL